MAPVPLHPTGLLQKSVPHPHLPDSEGVPSVLLELRVAPVNYRVTSCPWPAHPSHSDGPHSSLPWPAPLVSPSHTQPALSKVAVSYVTRGLPMSPAALGLCHST